MGLIIQSEVLGENVRREVSLMIKRVRRSLPLLRGTFLSSEEMQRSMAHLKSLY